MLHQKLQIVNKGSKIVVCARVGGANTTSFLAAHFAKRNTKNCGSEKRSGESEGGQKFLPPNPLPFCQPEPKRSPAALLVQSRGQQKSFLFLLEEKIGRAQIKKCEENFFAGQRAKRAAAGRSVQNSQSGFSSKKVRILTKRYRQRGLRAAKTALFLFMLILANSNEPLLQELPSNLL